MKEDKQITEKVSKELINPSIDLTIDYAEIALDTLFGDELLKQIPIVKTIFGITKIGMLVREKFLVKKILTFIKEFHQNKIDSENFKKFKEKFDSDSKYRSEVMDQIMILNDRFIEVNKSKILAHLFNAYIEKKISWDKFTYLSIVLDNLHPIGYKILDRLAQHGFSFEEGNEEHGRNRIFEEEALLYSCGIANSTSDWSSSFEITELGRDLYDFGIKNITKSK